MDILTGILGLGAGLAAIGLFLLKRYKDPAEIEKARKEKAKDNWDKRHEQDSNDPALD